MKINPIVVMVLALVCSCGRIAFAADAESQKKLNVLCVCAHPDDAEMNCGGTLRKYHKMVSSAAIIFLTSSTSTP